MASLEMICEPLARQNVSLQYFNICDNAAQELLYRDMIPTSQLQAPLMRVKPVADAWVEPYPSL